jgi:predicted regulator of Ras-like GTPase activity (Roadblock/LC7/MglB family)
MDAAQALGELMELSSQITAAAVLDGGGAVLASSSSDAERTAALAASIQELVATAADLGAEGRDVTRVEVELGEGAFFVVRDGGHVVGATTGPNPTSGLVVYDLRTCAQAITAPEAKKRRTRKPKEESA